MAGHSKWANIKHRKEKSDKKKGKIFSRIAKEIISSVRQNGPDPRSNNKLRIAIDKAKAANVPSDVVERNIKKASSQDQGDYFELTYELYGHGGVGIVVDVMTDNKNRIASDMRIATNKKGGTIAAPGAVVFNFDRKGIIQIPISAGKEEDLFSIAIESGAEDFAQEEDFYVVITPPDELFQVKEALERHGITVESSELEMIPKNSVECDLEKKALNIALISYLEDLDDVDAVYHNMKEE